MEHKLIITPKTKVLKVIEAYPELEEVLISYVPEFEKLKNPILRRTVAKFAKLQQAALIGKVKVEDLINILRKEVGQEQMNIENQKEAINEKPNWIDKAVITQSLDAREMLAAGEHPVNKVMADFKALNFGEIYLLTAPFLPQPLIEKVLSMGAEYWATELDSKGSVAVYFRKK